MRADEGFAAIVDRVGSKPSLCPCCGQAMVGTVGFGLTPKQAELYDYLADFIAEYNGVSPTFDEMASALGLKSKSGVHRLLKALEERGLIRRLFNRNRSIQLVGAA